MAHYVFKAWGRRHVNPHGYTVRLGMLGHIIFYSVGLILIYSLSDKW